MRVWQAANGWYLSDAYLGDILFSTQKEAEQAMAKLQTAQAIVSLVQTLVPVTDLSGDRTQEFYDVGPFSDADVAALGITSAQLTACIVLLEQAGKLMAGEATTVAIYRSTLNAVRRVAS